jgi:ABC-2 type transport system ATP-binding protein
LPALDTFELNRVIYKIPVSVFRERLDFFVQLLGIGDVVKKPVRQLSLGERMKCELVCALLHDPELIFLDEPTIGLDILSKETFRRFIKEVNRARKTTFIVTTHDLSDIENLCDNVLIINKGVKVFDGSLDELGSYFSDRNVFELDFSSPVPETELKDFKMLDYGSLNCRLEIELKNRPVKEVVSGLFERFPIKDISITSIPIEEVVKDIYRK